MEYPPRDENEIVAFENFITHCVLRQVMAFRDSVVSIGPVSPTSCKFSGSQLRHAYSQRDINHTGLPLQLHIPLSTISAEELLSIDIDFSGFLYKRSSERRTDRLTSAIQSKLNLPFIPKWQLRYVILYKDWLYYFASEKSKRPKGAFCLKGYHRVMRAEEAATTDQRYAFKIMGPKHNMRTYFFGAASEREMTLWMAHIRVTMEKALHGSARDRSLQLLEDLKRKNDRVLSRASEVVDECGSFRRTSSSSVNIHDEVYEDIEKPLPLYDDTESSIDFHPADIGDTRPLPQPPAEWGQDSGIEKRPVRTLPPIPVRPLSSRTGYRPKVPIRNSSSSPHKVPCGFRLPPLDSDDDDDEEDSITDYLLPSTMPSTSPQHPQRGNSTQMPRTVQHKPEPPRRKSAEDDRSTWTTPGLRRRPDGNSFRGKHEETKQFSKKPLPPKKPQILPKPTMGRPTATYNKIGAIKYILPDSAIFESSDKAKAEEMLKKPRVEGMFLIRNSAQPGQKVLMVYHGNEKCKHYKVFGDGTTFSLDGKLMMSSIQEILEHFKTHILPPSGTYKLTEPYPGPM